MKPIVKKTPLSRTKSAVSSELVSSLAAKSPSVDNIDGTCFRMPPPTYSTPPPPLWGPKPWPDESENLHRKLQRQLTLNPSCDPRLYRIQRQHQAVSRVLSCESPPTYPSSTHQHITRIASAPPSHPPVQMFSRPLSSASDPQLNLSTPPPALPTSWPIPPPTTPHPSSFHPSPNFEKERRDLCYHLVNLFPEDQVQTALSYYPYETDVKKICAAILTMFPPKP